MVNVSNNSGSQELSVTLDDTDGSIKAIFDAHDVHKRTARVYQYFSGLDLADKFLLFSGKVSSPIIWSERDRTVKFSILSQLEDKEIGFSAEEGQFPYLPADMVGKPWPMIFGKVVNCPTLQVNKAVTGTTLTSVGILSGMDLWASLSDGADDSQFNMSLLMMLVQINHLKKVKECWAPSFHPPIDAEKAADFRSRSTRSMPKSGRPWPAATSSGPAPWPAGSSRSTRPTPRAGRESHPHPGRRGFSAGADDHHQHQRRPVHRAFRGRAVPCPEPGASGGRRHGRRCLCGEDRGAGRLPGADAGKLLPLRGRGSQGLRRRVSCREQDHRPGDGDDQHQRHRQPDGHRAGGPALLGRSRGDGDDLQRRADHLHRLHRARHGLGGESLQATHRRAAAGGRADRSVHGHDPDLRVGDGRASRRQQAAEHHHGPGLERRSLRDLRVERRPGHRGHPQVPDRQLHGPDLGRHVVQSRPGEAPAVPGQLPDPGPEEHDPGLGGDRLPGPLRHLAQQRGVLPEVPARGADAGRHDHRERHRRRAGHRGGADRHGRHRDQDEGQVAAELGGPFGPGRRTRPRRRSSSGTTSPSTAPRSRSTTSTSTTSRTSCTSARRSG